MTSWNKKFAGVMFLFLLASLFINSEVFSSDSCNSEAVSHYIMGVMYDDFGDLDKALQEYKSALKSDNESSVIHLNLAVGLIKKYNFSEAATELNTAIRLDPEAVEPHAILAILYTSENKIDLARSEYEAALKNAAKLQPKNADIFKSLGAIYLQQRKFKEAEENYKIVLGLSPNDASVHFYLGSIYNELNKFDLAEKELKRAIELKADYHEALNYLGYIYVEANKNLDKAFTLINKAIELEPNSGAYIDSLGWYYFKKGNFEQALKNLEKAASLEDDPIIYDHLADTYYKLKNQQKAKSNWEKSLSLDPKQDKVKKKLAGVTLKK
ncbi:MAG: tetratricopeptide repeat protein [Candidatus Omnitrophica bacterium]|nr:tetratricopeptide repeat protein [Candidatus Omnitrophota bacterium]